MEMFIKKKKRKEEGKSGRVKRRGGKRGESKQKSEGKIGRRMESLLEREERSENKMTSRARWK